MINIRCTEEFAAICPSFRVAVIAATIERNVYTEELDRALLEVVQWVRDTFDLTSWKARPGIASTRLAYKQCGKDPNRYRPAAEQLGRRLINGQELYRVNAVVDFGNLLSLHTGFSIGAFDATRLASGDIMLKLGSATDHYEGIGRGVLNIDRLPTYSDALSAFATPTSDSERTKIEEHTQSVLIFINDFSAEAGRLEEAADYAEQSLRRYFSVASFSVRIIEPATV